MSKENTKINPFEEHPKAPKPDTSKAKNKDSWTREEVTRVLDKLVNKVRKQDTPTWGYSQHQLVDHLKQILPKLEKIRIEREDTESPVHADLSECDEHMYSKVIQYYEEVKERSSVDYTRAIIEYRDMANGGDGGSYNGSTLRVKYYRGYHDSFFRVVLTGLGESLESPGPINP